MGLAEPAPDTSRWGEHAPFSRGERRDEESSLKTNPLLTPVSTGDDVWDINPVAVEVGMTTGMCEWGPIWMTCGEAKCEVGTMCLVGVIMNPAVAPGWILVAATILPPISKATLLVGGAEFSRSDASEEACELTSSRSSPCCCCCCMAPRSAGFPGARAGTIMGIPWWVAVIWTNCGGPDIWGVTIWVPPGPVTMKLPE